MKNKTFGLNSYMYLLSIIKGGSKKIISFNDAYIGKTGIIMRHDVDFCPLEASKIAEMEAEVNIKSIFFFLVNSGLYNFDTVENIQAIKNIISLGHDVGLHFDSTKYINERSKLNLACENECNILKSITDKHVSTVSFHRPSPKFLGMKAKIAGRIHSYMPLFFNKFSYCSDSQGDWMYDDPELLIKNSNIKNIQLLTHPIWWTTPENMSPGEKIEFHLKNKNKNKNKNFQSLVAKNCRPYKLYLELKEKNIAE